MKKCFQVIMTFLLMFGAVFVVAGCEKDNKVINNKIDEKIETNNQEEKKKEADNLLKEIKIEQVEGKVISDVFLESQFDLAVKLFKESVSASKNKNVLISPLSVLLALSMTANGAEGMTKSEMEALLGGGITIEDLNEYLYTYVNSLPSDEQNKLKIANSIWYRDEEDLTLDEDFLQAVTNYYDAELYKAPFNETTLTDINNWVSKNTDGMIKKILNEIPAEAIMYLINAIVFDAKWDVAYAEEAIFENKQFTNILNEKQIVTMMSSVEQRYIFDSNAQGFIKPYKDNKYSFAALLPNEGVDIYDYINSLTKESLTNTLNNSMYASITASIPKFSCGYEITMNNILKNLGMKRAFDSKMAEFTKMVNSVRGNAYIGSVLHKTFISVDELGTKAAAVTVVEMGIECSFSYNYYIKLDRPFVYMIIDNQTNLPIFIGVLTNI